MKKKPVLQISYYSNSIINEFASQSEAAEKLGINPKNISSACNGKLISAGGYRWRFKNK